MARLIHLNGPPGIGKSTIARRYAADHPGALLCDVDVLRTMISGWSDDFGRAGALIRPAAIAMVEAYLRDSGDVVLPQMLVDPAEVARFEAAATRAGAEYVERYLMDDLERAVARFASRGADEPDDQWHAQVRRIVADLGGDAELARCHDGLLALLAARPTAVSVPSTEGDPEATYAALLATL